MSKGNTTKNDILGYLFQTAAPAWVAGSHLYVSLHTATPGDGGTQLTNEAAYTSYARVEVHRTAGAWTVTGNLCSNTIAITFPTCTGAAQTITHWAIGTVDTGGAGQILYHGQLLSPISVIVDTAPFFAVGDIDITEN